MNRKGFSLIELLAVVVILAIIATIATPIVLNIINDTKESSLLRSAEFYLDAVETAVAQSTLNDKKLENKTYNILENGNLCMEYKDNECIDELEVKVSGEVPSSGSITIESGKIKNVEVVLNNKMMVKDNDKWLYSGLYDENDNLIATWDELVNDYGIDVEKNYGTNDTSRPGAILIANEKLSKGVKLVIDSSVRNIGSWSFYEFTRLKEITIPNSVISIGREAFSNCSSLKEVTIPKSVTRIGLSAFQNCTSLKEITIPNSVSSMGSSVFAGCTNLTRVIIENGISIIVAGTFHSCTSLKEVTIPKSVTNISGNAFHSCTSLKEITIPNSVTTIYNYAFHGCKNLNSINYTGSEEQWNLISFGISWNGATPKNFTINYNYVVN